MHKCKVVTVMMFQKRKLNSHPFLYWNFVVVTDGVFTQEVKLHDVLLTFIFWIKVDVFNSQRAAADCVCSLPLLLLITRSQSQLVNRRTEGVNFH